MKKIFLYTLMIVPMVFNWSCAPDDQDGPNPEDVFVKFYGTGSNEAVDIVRTEDGDIIILAAHADEGADKDFYLIKTDPSGSVIDSRIIDMHAGTGDASQRSEDIPQRIKAIGNNEFLIIGYLEGLEMGVWGKINSDLELMRSYALDEPGFNFMEGFVCMDILSTTEDDGSDSYVLFGRSRTRRYAGDARPLGEYQLVLAKYSDAGDTLWQKSRGYLGDETALSVFPTSNGGYLMVGSTERASPDGHGGQNVFVLNTNRLGTPDEGEEIIGMSLEGNNINANDIPYAAKKSSLGYSIVGSTTINGQLQGFHMAVSEKCVLQENSVSVLSTDISGVTDLPFQALTFTRTLLNELMVLGSVPSFRLTAGEGGATINKLEEILVMKVSPISGRIAGFDQNYGTTVGNDRPNAALTLPDGDILVASTIDFGSGTTMVGLLRLNANGELRD